MRFDVFICHASEDKEGFVKPLANALVKSGLAVWYDDFSLTLGDSLRRSIDRGLLTSRYGIVVLSQAFFRKQWPQYELDGLVQREMDGHKVVLPIWHGVTREEVQDYSPALAGRLAVNYSEGLGPVVNAIVRALTKEDESTNDYHSRLFDLLNDDDHRHEIYKWPTPERD